MRRIDYDIVAAVYDGRYRDGGPADLASFVRVEVAARIRAAASGDAVRQDPILQRHGTSRLSLLTDRQFEEGMARVTRAAAGSAIFETDLRLFATTARSRSRT